MNRYEEVKRLKEEINTCPAELDDVVLRARKRIKKRKRNQIIFCAPIAMFFFGFLFICSFCKYVFQICTCL